MAIVIILAAIFCIVPLMYFSVRNDWVYNRRDEHIHRHLDEFHKIDKKFSYNDMLYKYFYVWDYNWFNEKTLERK